MFLILCVKINIKHLKSNCYETSPDEPACLEGRSERVPFDPTEELYTDEV